MAKSSGLGMTTLSVDDSAGTPVVIKNDVTNWSIGTPRAVQDITGVDKSARETLLLLADCSVSLSIVFNSAVSHTVFRTVSSTSVARTTTMVVNGATLAPEILYTDYPVQRGAGGELTATVPGVLADGTVPTWS